MSALNIVPGTLLRLIGRFPLFLYATLEGSNATATWVESDELAEVVNVDIYNNFIIRVWFPALRKYSGELINSDYYWRLANEEK